MGCFDRQRPGKFLSAVLAAVLLAQSAGAQGHGALLPEPVQRLSVGFSANRSGEMASFNSPVLNGLRVFAEEPLRFDFILDKGDEILTDSQVRKDSIRLIKYFLTSLTIPEEDLWVNLSPYEKDRIIPQSFGKTGMGQDLLEQDFVLKQLTTSLLCPDGKTGKKFWQKVYALAQEKYGTTDISIDAFNKVWIVPGAAEVYENKSTGSVYIIDARLKVMTRKDYLSTQMSASASGQLDGKASDDSLLGTGTDVITGNVLREVILPLLQQEVNEGKDFVLLRQVYRSLILAVWYKKNIQRSLLQKVYVDRNKTAGVDTKDPGAAIRVWKKYEESFGEKSYRAVLEDIDPGTNEIISRQYVIGGVELGLSPYLRVLSGDDRPGIVGTGREVGLTAHVVEVVDNAELVFDVKDVEYLRGLGISAEEASELLSLGSTISGRTGDSFGLSLVDGIKFVVDQALYIRRLLADRIRLARDGRKVINIIQIGVGSSAVETKDLIDELVKAFDMSNIDLKQKGEWRVNFIVIDERDDWLIRANQVLNDFANSGVLGAEIKYKSFQADILSTSKMKNIAGSLKMLYEEWDTDFIFFRNVNYANQSAGLFGGLLSENPDSMAFELSAAKTLSVYVSLRNIFRYLAGDGSLFVAEPVIEGAKKALLIPGTVVLSESSGSESDRVLSDSNDMRNTGTGIYQINNSLLLADEGLEGFLRLNLQPSGLSGKSLNVASPSVVRDAAQSLSDKGGIDLDLERFGFGAEWGMPESQLNIDPVMLDHLNRANGLAPLILNITPHVNVALFLESK
jgi:hypothetical protein